MTDDKIDLLLLRHLDPDHESLHQAPAHQVSARLGWMIRQGYIISCALSPEWMEHEAIQRVGYRRSSSGNERFIVLLEQFI